MTNAYQGLKLEFHIIQSFPVTCLNRDDVGSPKTAIVGGVARARVSSQCWKRQVRLALADQGVKLATRSKKVADMFAQACVGAGASAQQGQECGEKMAKELADDTLLFVSDTEAKAFAGYAQGIGFAADKITHKELAKVAKKALTPGTDALDIALFGRMVAKAPDMNIEAAAAFSHAISTHKATTELDFFTALDDLQDEPGSAHMGSTEFNSATYYRYVSLDLGQLAQSMEAQDVKTAVEAFIKALFVAVPSARQATQSGACPWDFAQITLRRGQRLQVPFDQPVKSSGNGYAAPSVDALKGYLDSAERRFGSMFGKVASVEWGNSEASIDDVIATLQSHL